MTGLPTRMPPLPSARTAAALALVLSCVAVVAHEPAGSPREADLQSARAGAGSPASAQPRADGVEPGSVLPEQAAARTVLAPLPGSLEFAAAVEAAIAAQANRGLASPGGVHGPPAAAERSSGIPEPVLAAYRAAETEQARARPSCGLSWWLLAGIGQVESGHAAGGRVDDTGRTRGNILGPRLDGTLAGTATIRDSDGGRLDGDPQFDRAVGPMQFLPGTWDLFGLDGSGDGVADPHNVRDAALGAARYLCASGADLRTPEGRNRALLRYNNSSAYVTKVLGFAQLYADGAIGTTPLAGDIPTSPAPPPPLAEAAAAPASPTGPQPGPPPASSPSSEPSPTEPPAPTEAPPTGAPTESPPAGTPPTATPQPTASSQDTPPPTGGG